MLWAGGMDHKVKNGSIPAGISYIWNLHSKLSYVSFSVRISAADLCGVFVLIPASYHVW